jgi:peptidoglycan hydrolase-like protein with peptidoglycan-binding domain
MQTGQGDPAVKNLQIALGAAGIKVNTDGRFGPQTEAAVRRLQQQHGITVDGIVGPETKGLLVGLETGKQTAKAAAKAKTPTKTVTKPKKDQPAVLRTKQPTPRHGSRTGGSRMKLTPPKAKVATLKYSVDDVPEPNLEETTVAFGYGGQPSRSIKDHRSQGEPLVDQDLWTRFQALANPPDTTIKDQRYDDHPQWPGGDLTIQDDRERLTVTLGEAIAQRKAAVGGRQFARARAREQLLRAKLLEAGAYEEARHPRGRGGKWIEVLNKLKALPVNKPQEINGVPAMRLSTGHYAAAVQGTMVHDSSAEKVAKAIDAHVSHREELHAHGERAMTGLSSDAAREFTRDWALRGDPEGLPERHEMWSQVYDEDPKGYTRAVFSQEMTAGHRAEAEKALADAKERVGRRQAEPYFDMTQPHELHDINNLHPIHQDPSEHIAKAARYMDEAARGGRSKRKPITGVRNKDGTVTITDGKGTLQASRDRGLTHLPVSIVDNPQSVELTGGEKVKVPQGDSQAEQIRRDALKYNSDFPEAHEGILKGTPAMHVSISPAGAHGNSSSGWRANIRPVVVMPDGGHAAAGENVTTKRLRRFDGRRSGIEHAQRGKKYLGLAGAKVPIIFHDTETRTSVREEPKK